MKMSTFMHSVQAALILYMASFSTYETKQIVGLLFGSLLQYFYLPRKNFRVLFTILLSSIFIGFFILDPIMYYYNVDSESFLRLPVISSSGFISTIILSTGLTWLPEQLKLKLIDLLKIQDHPEVSEEPRESAGDYYEPDKDE